MKAVNVSLRCSGGWHKVHLHPNGQLAFLNHTKEALQVGLAEVKLGGKGFPCAALLNDWARGYREGIPARLAYTRRRSLAVARIQRRRLRGRRHLDPTAKDEIIAGLATWKKAVFHLNVLEAMAVELRFRGRVPSGVRLAGDTATIQGVDGTDVLVRTFDQGKSIAVKTDVTDDSRRHLIHVTASSLANAVDDLADRVEDAVIGRRLEDRQDRQEEPAEALVERLTGGLDDGVLVYGKNVFTLSTTYGDLTAEALRLLMPAFKTFHARALALQRASRIRTHVKNRPTAPGDYQP